MPPAIEICNVTVKYRVPKQHIPSFKEFAIHWVQRRIEYHDFWALRNIDLSVKRGEVLGVIGRNGAGKSTLLKVIARVLKPTKGYAVVRGPVAPLLEISAGFDPDLTGRENVFLNGALLGLTKNEMNRRFDGIVEFAEIGDFIDAPLRTYSSGMMTRLAFAVATDVDAEILLVDEVLAVGDERFQLKCKDRIDRFRKNGVAIVLVSHSAETIRELCDRALWLERGEIHAIGDGRAIAFEYLEFLGTGLLRRTQTRYFHPDWTMTRGELAQVMVLACRIPIGTPSEPSFEDVRSDSPYYLYVEAASDHGAVAGDGKGYFRPTETISRAEAVVMMGLLANYAPEHNMPSGFSDIKGDEWFAGYVRAAERAGILPPEWGSEFQPTVGVKRVEAVHMAVRVAQLSPCAPEHATFGDVGRDLSCWMDVETAVGHGLIAAGDVAGSLDS